MPNIPVNDGFEMTSQLDRAISRVAMRIPPIYRHFLISFALVLPAPALAQQLGPDDFARSMSALISTIGQCPPYIKINKELMNQMLFAYQDSSNQTYGKQVMLQAINQEFPRREKEVNITGARIWCERTRARYLEQGLTQMFQ